MAAPIDFSTNKIIKVKVWSPVAGRKLLLKFEGSPTDFDNGAFETEVTITTANAWEELTFDYSSPSLFPPVNNNDTKIVFFFDFGTQGDGGPILYSAWIKGRTRTIRSRKDVGGADAPG